MVTLVSFLLALRFWWEGPSYVIAFTVFCGQLVVGWTNDLVDLPLDQKEGRTNKPMVDGKLSPTTVKRATWVALVFVTLFSHFGPMGIITSISNQIVFRSCPMQFHLRLFPHQLH